MILKIQNIASVPSTNNFLFEKIGEEEVREGLVIVAGEQTAGKGMGKNIWESESGQNLTFSILLKPEFLEAGNQFVITQMVSLSVLNVLNKYLTTEVLKVKWPNDIYVSDKKIAGILVQNIVKGKSISHSVVGIGINVNQRKFLSDAPNPVSMFQLSGKEFVLPDLLNELLNELKKSYLKCKNDSSQAILANTYLDNLYRFRQNCFFKDAGGRFKGAIVGINKYGQLLVQCTDGEIRTYSYKEVEFELF